MKVADLFGGCGGFSLGFDYLSEDFELVYALDSWQVACDSYKANYPYADVDCRDALTVKPKEIPKVDVIIGGPPCQEFSVARAHLPKKQHKPTFDMSLVNWFLSVVEYQKPKFWIMENVAYTSHFVQGNFKREIYRMIDFGVPQLRKRLFYGVYHEPTKEPARIRFPAVMASEMKGGTVYRPPFMGIKLSSVFRRRCLIAEAKLVQTFPLDYIVLGKLKDQYTQIGNAVPPLMSYRLAEALVNPQQQILEAPRN